MLYYSAILGQYNPSRLKNLECLQIGRFCHILDSEIGARCTTALFYWVCDKFIFQKSQWPPLPPIQLFRRNKSIYLFLKWSLDCVIHLFFHFMFWFFRGQNRSELQYMKLVLYRFSLAAPFQIVATKSDLFCALIEFYGVVTVLALPYLATDATRAKYPSKRQNAHVFTRRTTS